MRIQQKSTIEELYDRLWKTKSARFNAYQRLIRTHLLSSYSTNLLSVYVIILTLLQPFNIIKNLDLIRIINFATICVSILLLVFVLMESSMQYNLKAEKFHDCAKSISKLFKKFEFIKEEDSTEELKYAQYKKIQKKYDKIIDLYENHRPIDFKYFQALNKIKNFADKPPIKLFGLSITNTNLYRIYITFKYNHLIYIHYYFVIFILPILLFFLIYVKK